MNCRLQLLTPKESNAYFQHNAVLFDTLLDLVQSNNYGYMNVLRLNKSYSEVASWINNSLPLLSDKRYTTATKVCWILHGLTEFPVCQNRSCRKPFSADNVPVQTANTNPFLCYGNKKFCSRRCTALAEQTQELKKQTNLERHGVENWNNRDLAFQTIYDTYGENAFDLFFEWSCDAKEQIYGDRFYSNVEKIKRSHALRTPEQKAESTRKAFATYHNKTGYDVASQNPMLKPIIASHIRDTMLRNYGVTSFAQTQEYKDFMIELNLSTYGVSSYMQTDDFKSKSCQTMLKNYGVPYYTQSQEFKDLMADPDVNAERMRKQFETKKLNGTLHTSGPEAECFELLKQKFGADDVDAQYISAKYPFHCDFYIKSRDLYIELNAHWSHGGHFFDGNNENDVKKVEYWKSKNSEYYDNCIYVWTDLDKRKAEYAISNQLHYLVFWHKDELIAWVNSMK